MSFNVVAPLCVVVSVALTGCATVTMPELSIDHPANADAPTAEVAVFSHDLQRHTVAVIAPPLPIGTARATQPPRSGHAHHSTELQTSGLFVCPMHADVTSTTPGECPKCGMDLELQEES